MASVSIEQLLARLGIGKPVPGILLLGQDAYLRELCRRKITEAFVPEGVREWGVSKFSAQDDTPGAILRQAQTLPMLAQQQVIFVTGVEAWERLGEKSREELVSLLCEYLDDPAPFSVLVFEAAALDQRMRLAKVLSQKTIVVSAEISNNPAERLKLAGPLAVEMAREIGVEFDREAAGELAELLNGDLVAIRTELEKLAAYAGSRLRITRADVELLVVSERKHTVWELADVLAARQPARAMEILDSLLREGEQPAQLLGALAWMYRKLLEAQELPAEASEWQAASRLGMRPETARLAVRQARRFPRAQLARGISDLYGADSRLKSGGTNQRAVLEFLIAQLLASTAA
jgi:DNA polymerase III subunit delta